MSTRLADLFPQPKMLTLGGGKWLVSEYRLRDLASMESWCEARLPDPFALIDATEPGTPVRRKALRAAFDLVADGLPGIDSPAASAMLATPEGLAFRLWLSVGRSHPEFSLIVADETVAAMSDAEWSAFNRVAWGADPYEAIDAEINAECGIKLPPKSQASSNVTWMEAYLSSRMSIERFGNLTLNQWRGITEGGKPKDRCVSIPFGWTMAKFNEEYGEKRKAFFGEEEKG